MDLPLPPHARGRPLNRQMLPLRGPSTPACAGLTTVRLWAGRWRSLYPRTRGADMSVVLDAEAGPPLPPHTRG